MGQQLRGGTWMPSPEEDNDLVLNFININVPYECPAQNTLT